MATNNAIACCFLYLTAHTLRMLGLNSAGVAAATFVVTGTARNGDVVDVIRCANLAECRAAFRTLDANPAVSRPSVEIWWSGDATPVRTWAPSVSCWR